MSIILSEYNIKSEINRMLEYGKEFTFKKCIILHPNQIEQLKKSTEDVELLEDITIYNIVDTLLFQNKKWIDDYENKMILQEDKGLEYYKEIIGITQAIQNLDIF